MSLGKVNMPQIKMSLGVSWEKFNCCLVDAFRLFQIILFKCSLAIL